MKFLLLMCFLLIGCDDGGRPDTNEITKSAQSKICTKEQLELVKLEFSVCKETGYFSSFCYDMAKNSHCGDKK